MKKIRYWDFKETGTSYRQRFDFTDNQWQHVLQKKGKSAKLGKTRKLWYLLLCNFECYCQILVFRGKAGQWSVYQPNFEIFLIFELSFYSWQVLASVIKCLLLELVSYNCKVILIVTHGNNFFLIFVFVLVSLFFLFVFGFWFCRNYLRKLYRKQ